MKKKKKNDNKEQEEEVKQNTLERMKKVGRDNTKKVECLKREMKINFSLSLGMEGLGKKGKKL